MEHPKLTVDRSFVRGLSAFNRDRLRWLDEAAALGPLVRLQFGQVNSWVVTDVDVARRVLITDAAFFVRPLNFRRPTSMAIGANLFTESQEQWEAIGPFLSPQLHGASITRRLETARALIEDDVSHWPLGVPIDLDEATSRLVLRAACVLLFDYELDYDRANEMVHHQRALMAWLGDRIGRPISVIPFAPGRAGRGMREHRDAFYSGIGEIIRHGRLATGQDTVMSTLLSIRQRGSVLSEQALCGHVAGLLGAGNDVTGASLSWALVHGAQNPGEFLGLGTSNGDVRSYVLESIRLSSCAWSLTRVPTRKVTLTPDGRSTEVGRRSPVIIYLRGMNRNPSVWADPERFNLARHSADEKSLRREFIPFGLGGRGCPGQQVALAELGAALPAIAQRGRMRIESDVMEDPLFAIRVRGGLRGRIEPINESPARHESIG
jgi:cytochrome P450